MSEVHNPKSENCCLKSTIGSLMYEVWRNLKFDVRRLSENCLDYSKVWSTTYVYSKPGVQKPKSEVQSRPMSKVQNPSPKPKFEVCQLSKSETEVQSLTPKFEVESLKSKVYLKSVQSFLQLL